MMKKCLMLLVLFWMLFWLPTPAMAQEQDQIQITLRNHSKQPISGWKISLVTYRFNARGTTAEEIPSGECVTDANGRCTLLVLDKAARDPSGFLRGSLNVAGQGERSVLWPGGTLTMVLQLDPGNHLAVDGQEAAPFDDDPVTRGVQIIPEQPPFYLIGIPIGLLIFGLCILMYLRSKKR